MLSQPSIGCLSLQASMLNTTKIFAQDDPWLTNHQNTMPGQCKICCLDTVPCTLSTGASQASSGGEVQSHFLDASWHCPRPHPLGAEGQGKLSSPSAAGQHSSPEHHTPLPGHCTASPTLQRNSVVQSCSFAAISHRWSPHPFGAEGHGKFGPPATPGQHCSPLHKWPFVPGH